MVCFDWTSCRVPHIFESHRWAGLAGLSKHILQNLTNYDPSARILEDNETRNQIWGYDKHLSWTELFNFAQVRKALIRELNKPSKRYIRGLRGHLCTSTYGFQSVIFVPSVCSFFISGYRFRDGWWVDGTIIEGRSIVMLLLQQIQLVKAWIFILEL